MSLYTEQYEKAIPAYCRYQTAREHFEYLCWCWGLQVAIQDAKPMECGECELATRRNEVQDDDNRNF